MLTVCDKVADLDAAITDTDCFASLGTSSRPLSTAECTALEPGVDRSGVSMAGAIPADGDETAGCLRFCHGWIVRL